LGGVTGAGVLVVSVAERWTVEEPSFCCVVVSLVSELVLSPPAFVVVDCVLVVVVDFGGVLLAQAPTPSVATSNNVTAENVR